MPVPIIVPVVAALGAGAIGFLLGRKMAPTSEDDYEDILTPDPNDEQAGPGEESEAGPFGMTEAEALKVLELEAGATPDEIREAHRRLIQRLHPDQGGSTYLAGLINRAKDVLLSE